MFIFQGVCASSPSSIFVELYKIQSVLTFLPPFPCLFCSMGVSNSLIHCSRNSRGAHPVRNEQANGTSLSLVKLVSKNHYICTFTSVWIHSSVTSTSYIIFVMPYMQNPQIFYLFTILFKLTLCWGPSESAVHASMILLCNISFRTYQYMFFLYVKWKYSNLRVFPLTCAINYNKWQLLWWHNSVRINSIYCLSSKYGLVRREALCNQTISSRPILWFGCDWGFRDTNHWLSVSLMSKGQT